MSYLLWIIVGLIALFALWAIGTFNTLIRLRNQVQNGWSQIDVQLQRRYDLIPNLVESVKGYMKHERETLNAVVTARNQAVQAKKALQEAGGPTQASLKNLLEAEGALKGPMMQLFALAENYPQLRASENMQQLQEELATTENKVAFSRQAYNDNVLYYNNFQQQFPANLLATTFGHHSAEFFEIDSSEAKKAVKVTF
ncbi:MAG: LemA family protein [Chlamydiia bacterium]|nr:LemA family protein [Chlamydiia bacterium]